MTATLQRQDAAGSTLVLDGIVSSRELRDFMVSQHPAQGLATITDNVQAKALGKVLDVVISPNPTVPGITAGPQRIAEVIDWLEASIGILLTLTEPGLPVRRDMLIQGRPWEQRGTTSATFSLSLIQATFAQVTTFDLETTRRQRTNQTPREDQAAGFTPTADKGQQPVKEQSALAAGLDLVGSLF